MTSATLRTDESFDYIQGRLDAEDVQPIAIDTPFDYKRNTLLYLVDDIPEPSDFEAYQREVERGLLSLIRASDGRVMVLFTSYAQLRRTVNAIGDALERDNITIYDQSGGSSRSQLLEGFVESQRAVLMGTRSFWEGVDVPGEDLSVLVIVRLPFSVPSDPLYAARSELFDNPFQQYAIPETILRFRQGFGRLIRRKSDYGVVAIFDRRVLSKSYGPLFLHALPECTVQNGSMKDLPEATIGWLAKFK
jgi:DNA polymerase-3 subunit epsilon/ATP-dependent DNA helicase DinG